MNKRQPQAGKKQNKEGRIFLIGLGGLLLAGLLAVFFMLGLPKIREARENTALEAGEAAEDAAAEVGEAPADTPAETGETAEGVDYAAIFALHDPEEIVMTVDGRGITWQDYYYAYCAQADSTEQQFRMYQNYGFTLGWESLADEEGHSYAQLLDDMAEQNLRQILTAEAAAAEERVSLSPEDEAAVRAEHQENIQYFCGENGTEEQLFARLLEERGLRPELYWRILRFSALTGALSRNLYGEEGALLSEEQVLDWMEEQGIVSANHILIATVDLNSNQPLDEAAAAEKAELARQIASELQVIEDPAEREKRFLELKEQYCEDGGDYVFGPGVMVPEFYDGTLALEEGQVSDPIRTQYGYHIILRRPLHADDSIFIESGEENARSLMAQTLFDQKMNGRYEAQIVEYAPGFAAPDIQDYIRKPVA